MGLEIVGYGLIIAEVMLVVVLTLLLPLPLPLPLPLLRKDQEVVIGVITHKYLLKPFISVVSFALFLLIDTYKDYHVHLNMLEVHKYNMEVFGMKVEAKSLVEIQRNALLIALALILYLLLYILTPLLIQIQQLNHQRRSSSIPRSKED